MLSAFAERESAGELLRASCADIDGSECSAAVVELAAQFKSYEDGGKEARLGMLARSNS